VTAAAPRRPAGGGEVERADRLLGDAQRTADAWISQAIDWVARLGARAWEEAEDLWDDANAVRRGD
jgi:hypothetical protein